jgi:transcriptional regulator with XRE-family HTH domain
MTLQEWKRLTKVTDEQLAAAVREETGEQISRSQINRIRKGLSNPRLKTAKALEAVTKIPAAQFMLGEAGEKAA